MAQHKKNNGKFQDFQDFCSGHFIEVYNQCLLATVNELKLKTKFPNISSIPII